MNIVNNVSIKKDSWEIQKRKGGKQTSLWEAEYILFGANFPSVYQKKKHIKKHSNHLNYWELTNRLASKKTKQKRQPNYNKFQYLHYIYLKAFH